MNERGKLDIELERQVLDSARDIRKVDAKAIANAAHIRKILETVTVGFLPTVFYGLVLGGQTWRFNAGMIVTPGVTLPGSIEGDIYQFIDPAPTSDYIPAIGELLADGTLQIIIQGDYTHLTNVFNLVNSRTGVSTQITNSLLAQMTASSLLDYPANDPKNRGKSITVIQDLSLNASFVQYGSIDLQANGVFNWVRISERATNNRGTGVYIVNTANIDAVVANAILGDVLLAGMDFMYQGISFARGNLYQITGFTPFAVSNQGNILQNQGIQGFQGIGIQSIIYTGSVGLNDTYTVTLLNPADGTTSTTTFTVTNGRGIATLTLTGTVDNVDTYTITFNDGTTFTFDVTNGVNGMDLVRQSGLYSTLGNWGLAGNNDNNGNPLLQLPTLPSASVAGKSYIVFDPITFAPSSRYYEYWASGTDNVWTVAEWQAVKGDRGDDGRGISSITLLSQSGLLKTYRINFTDNSPAFDFVVADGANGANGRGISSVILNAASGTNPVVKTYRITFTDATTFDFQVTDGTTQVIPVWQLAFEGQAGTSGQNISLNAGFNMDNFTEICFEFSRRLGSNNLTDTRIFPLSRFRQITTINANNYIEIVGNVSPTSPISIQYLCLQYVSNTQIRVLYADATPTDNINMNLRRVYLK